MGLCNSLPLFKCHCVSILCCYCCCLSCQRRPDRRRRRRRANIQSPKRWNRSAVRERISPLTTIFNRQQLATTGDEDGVWRFNVSVRSDWNEDQPMSAEVSPLLENNAASVRIVQSRTLTFGKIDRIDTAGSQSKSVSTKSFRDVSFSNKTSPSPTARSSLRAKGSQRDSPVPPHPGLSDFWNELGHTLHHLRFKTPVMCEVSYKTNRGPAARLFIPAGISGSSPLFPPPSPSSLSTRSTPALRSPFAVRSNQNVIRVSSLREKSGIF